MADHGRIPFTRKAGLPGPVFFLSLLFRAAIRSPSSCSNEMLRCYLRKKISKILTFGIVCGVSVSLLSYFLLSPDKTFLHFTIPLTCAYFVFGSLYRYAQSFLKENWSVFVIESFVGGNAITTASTTDRREIVCTPVMRSRYLFTNSPWQMHQ